MVISPPLVIEESEIDLMMERIGIALDSTVKSLKEEGLYC